MGRKQILRGFSVFSRPIFLICVCVGNVKRFVWFLGLVVWLAAAKSWFGSCMCWSPGAVCWWDGLVSGQTCKFACPCFVQHGFLMLHVKSDGQIVECVLCFRWSLSVSWATFVLCVRRVRVFELRVFCCDGHAVSGNDGFLMFSWFSNPGCR